MRFSACGKPVDNFYFSHTVWLNDCLEPTRGRNKKSYDLDLVLEVLQDVGFTIFNFQGSPIGCIEPYNDYTKHFKYVNTFF